MEKDTLIEEIKKQALLTEYKKFIPSFNTCKTQQELFKIFNSSPNFFGDFFALFKEQVLKDNFNINYQPQISNNRCNSAEALFRCKIGDTFLNPEVMFALSGFFGFERDLNTIILNKICEDVRTFTTKISSDFKVSLNINPELMDKSFYDVFYFTLRNKNISPKSIGIELLETSSFEKVDANLIRAFMHNGTEIYLDDFGTGFANIKTLTKMPFTHVKFPGELVSGIDSNAENQNYILNTLDYCNKNGIKTVFEHVETEEELQTVNSLTNNSGIIQGYYYSKPLESDELVKYVNNFNQSKEDDHIEQ